MSALGGSRAPAWDAFARDLDIEGTARCGFEALPPESQQFVAAYADGVRAGFAEGASSPELAGRPAPGAWQPWTPLAVFLVQHVLFAGFHKAVGGVGRGGPRPADSRSCSGWATRPTAATPSPSAEGGRRPGSR